MSRSRREFVKLAATAAATSAGTMVLPRRALAQLDGRQSAQEALGVADPGADPHELAAVALDAARSAGATFVDVRVDHSRSQGVEINETVGGAVDYGDGAGVGVRVLTNGQWGFASTVEMTPDAVAEVARRATHQAQVNAKWRRTSVELVPTPVVTDGRWATPVQVDPFDVPIGEQQEALLAGTTAALDVGRGVKSASCNVGFGRVDRVFASSEGSSITQSFSLASGGGSVSATVGDPSLMVRMIPKGLAGKVVGGYEAVRSSTLPETMRTAAVEAQRVAKELMNGVAVPRSVDVGRYELVAGPGMFWGLIAGTLIPALSMERALGRRVGLEGSTFAAPPDATLGRMRMGAPYLTVRGDRSTPGGLMNCGWDDEGVKPDDFALIEQGVLVDYLATRETAPLLGSWYHTRGMTPHAHGVATTEGGSGPPGEAVPNVTVDPGTADVTVDDMIKDVKHGIYCQGGEARCDFGMLTAFGALEGVQEIRNGRLVGPLKDVAIQFQIAPFWKGLVAIGGPRSVESFTEGIAIVFLCRTVRSVPARFREVSVVNIGRRQ
jgi:TldD protein